MSCTFENPKPCLGFLACMLIDATLILTVSSVSEKEDASASETTGGSDKVNDDQSLLDEGSALRLVAKIVSVGLERLDRSIKFVTGHGSEGGDRDDRSNDGLSEANEDADRAETTTTSGPSSSHEGAEQLLSEVDKKWLRHLTLGQPDLLDALCQNIARQQHGGSSLQVDAQRELDADVGGETSGIRVEEVLQDDSVRSSQAILGTLEYFEVGISVINYDFTHILSILSL